MHQITLILILISIFVFTAIFLPRFIASRTCTMHSLVVSLLLSLVPLLVTLQVSFLSIKFVIVFVCGKFLIIILFAGSSDEHKYSETLLHPITRKLCSFFCCLPSCCTGESSPRPKRVPSMSEKLASQDFPSQIDTINEKSPKIFCYTNDAFNADTDNRGQEVIS